MFGIMGYLRCNPLQVAPSTASHQCNVEEPLIGGVMDPQAEEPEHHKHHRSRDFLVVTTMPSLSAKMQFCIFSSFSCSSLNQDALHFYSFPSINVLTDNGKVNLANKIKSTMKELALSSMGLKSPK